MTKLNVATNRLQGQISLRPRGQDARKRRIPEQWSFVFQGNNNFIPGPTISKHNILNTKDLVVQCPSWALRWRSLQPRSLQPKKGDLFPSRNHQSLFSIHAPVNHQNHLRLLLVEIMPPKFTDGISESNWAINCRRERLHVFKVITLNSGRYLGDLSVETTPRTNKHEKKQQKKQWTDVDKA